MAPHVGCRQTSCHPCNEGSNQWIECVCLAEASEVKKQRQCRSGMVRQTTSCRCNTIGICHNVRFMAGGRRQLRWAVQPAALPFLFFHCLALGQERLTHRNSQ
eukprot:scaffold1431_cov346-Pavlova_lutheri.AAC.15